jgi:hypothetical protein
LFSVTKCIDCGEKFNQQFITAASKTIQQNDIAAGYALKTDSEAGRIREKRVAGFAGMKGVQS